MIKARVCLDIKKALLGLGIIWGKITIWLRLGNGSGHGYKKPTLTVGRKQESYSWLSFQNEQMSKTDFC